MQSEIETALVGESFVFLCPLSQSYSARPIRFSVQISAFPGTQVKIADFGVSGKLANSVADCASWVGTVTYMSPERISGACYSFDSDVWSLGLSMMECAEGTSTRTSRCLLLSLCHRCLLCTARLTRARTNSFPAGRFPYTAECNGGHPLSFWDLLVRYASSLPPAPIVMML